MNRKRTLLLALTACAGWLTLTSNSTGPALNGNGDRSDGNCAGSGCHSANSTATVVQSVVLVDVSSGQTTPAGQYLPGRTYAVSILGNLNPASASLTHFGFQTTARNAASNATVGTIDLAGTTSLHTYTAGGRTGVEHSARIAKNSAGFFTTTWRWTAPPAGTGAVKFYTIINAVNNNGAVSGDQPNVGTTEFSEGTLDVNDVVRPTAVSVHPNPAKDFIKIDTRSWRNGDYGLTIFGTNGAVVMQQSLRHHGASEVEIKLPELSTGLYGVRIQGDGAVQSAPLFIR